MSGRRVDLIQHATSVGVLRRLRERVSLGIGVGVVAGGELVVGGRRHRMQPGGSFSVALSREWLGGARDGGFLTTSLIVSGSFATTSSRFERSSFYAATDVSFAVAVGKTLWNTWSPYVGARVFGGPVWWTAVERTVPGQDPDHHSLSIGSVLTLPRNLELAVDWAPIGARAVTAQAAVSF